MSEHYFTTKPQSEHDVRQFAAQLRGKEYHFATDAGVFSRDDVDKGTRLLIDALTCQPGEDVLDLGCGYGPVGIAAADLVAPHGHVYMVDINERAVELATANARTNGVQNANVLLGSGVAALPDGLTLDWVVTNPPIRAGKKVLYDLMSQAHSVLKTGGGLMVVIRTKQGAKSLEKYLVDLFGNSEIIARGSGFRVFCCFKHLHS